MSGVEDRFDEWERYKARDVKDANAVIDFFLKSMDSGALARSQSADAVKYATMCKLINSVAVEKQDVVAIAVTAIRRLFDANGELSV